MTERYFVDKALAMSEIKKVLPWGIGSFILTALLIYLHNVYDFFVIIPHLLALPAFAALAISYRSFILLFFPIAEISDEKIRYFSMLWYTTHFWSKVEIIECDDPATYVAFMLNNGGILEKIEIHLLPKTASTALLAQVNQLAAERNIPIVSNP